ncbi:S8 family peptidase [Tenacibaculum sp. TC6]|uniref:S8 family peptidase n=1 Tax=Tenacibaculum sp. TC6 TaxID=3423223 RepID=UPI003D36B467
MDKRKRPILYNGEIYGKPIEKSGGFGEKHFPISYDQARETILSNIRETKMVIEDMPSTSRLPNEIVLSMIIHPDFLAKSYYPKTLFNDIGNGEGLVEIGSRIWRPKSEYEIKPNNELNLSKMFFVRTTEESLNRFEQKLHRKPSTLRNSFIKDIQKVTSLGLMPQNEQIFGISDDWNEGRLEVVLHPFNIDRGKSLNHFIGLIQKSGIDERYLKYKQYENGISFISLRGNRSLLENIKGYNPLRTLHPLEMRSLPQLSRGTLTNGAPKPPVFQKKPEITVGVIDGGINDQNPFLKNYSESEVSVNGQLLPGGIDHGTQVSGAVLYGPLNKFGKNDVLPEPPLSIKSFGVLTNQTKDPDLYDVIDAIETIIPNNKAISVYNLSLGPKGPIYDDSISRFTFSCDQLSKKYNILFCIAVGNDGDVDGYDRIQSPSDSVNNLAVGAYTKKDGEIVRAPYSSIGPGREGNKMKPDIMAFGGCDQHPIHLISNTVGKKSWNMGTSFASPLVARNAALLVGESNGVISPLVAKTLLIHRAVKKEKTYSYEMGHGSMLDSIDDITNCGENSYTLIYKGEIQTGKYAEFPIPWDESIDEGTVEFNWTASVLTDVDHLSSDDYTSSTVETTFYPNKNKYQFKNVNNIEIDGKIPKTKIIDIVANQKEYEVLLEQGWEQSKYPVTNSAVTQFKSESELRNDLKWDSLDIRSINKKANGISNPVFHIHALGRGNRAKNDKVSFSLLLSVRAPKAKVDIYNKILNKYSALVPLRIETNVDIQVNNN